MPPIVSFFICSRLVHPVRQAITSHHPTRCSSDILLSSSVDLHRHTASSVQLRESFQTAANTTNEWPSSSATLHTGSTSPTWSGSGCASKSTSVSTAWLTDIWLSSADLSPTCDLLLWPATRSASHTFNIRRTRVLLCQTFSLECSSWLLKTTNFLSAFRCQLKHFYFSLIQGYLRLMHYINYLLT